MDRFCANLRGRRMDVTRKRLVALGAVVALASCGASSATPTPSPAPLASIQAGGGAGGAGAAGAGGGGAGGGGGNGAGGASQGPESPDASPSFTPLPNAGPWAVKQIETLGGETISGAVCDMTRPFVVQSVTPKVAFTFVFTPRDGAGGAVAYKYSIPSAGESHAATGTYTATVPGGDGVVHIQLAIRDHVVFKGFDGTIPLRYKFDLVPTPGITCPSG